MSIDDSHKPAWGSYISGAIGTVQDATVVAPVNMPEPQENLPPVLTKQEMAEVRELMGGYSGSPEIQGAVAQLITAHAENPQQLTALVRELMQKISAVQQDPHREITGVNPEISAILRDIQAVEKAKPDPLNAFRDTPEVNPPPAPDLHVLQVDYTPQPNITQAMLGALPTPNVPDVRGMQVARDDVGSRFV